MVPALVIFVVLEGGCQPQLARAGCVMFLFAIVPLAPAQALVVVVASALLGEA